MSTEYKLPSEQDEMIFYFPKIEKRKDHLNLKTILYVRGILEKLINEHNIQPDQSIGFVSDQMTIQLLMAELIEGYQNYWGLNITSVEDDIDFDNPCQSILRFPGAL